nr:very short patch repair endonuclease [Pseudomonas thermotolerans]
MRAIRPHDTKPELIVRRVLREIGFPGYRLHPRNYPGKPDIAFIGRKKAIFVNGCFWHRHNCRLGQRLPKSNLSYWLPKLDRNVARDKEAFEQLMALGWDVLVLWECEVKNHEALRQALTDFLRPPRISGNKDSATALNAPYDAPTSRPRP